MRRSLYILVALLLVVTTVLGASAISATSAGSYATASRDSSCQVTMSVTLHIDQVRDDLTFPVPGDATSVTVNGSRVRTTKENGVRQIDLDRILGKITGDFSLSIHYALADVVHPTETEALELRLPLLSGFAYPIEKMEFSVTLPGVVETLPTFESGYHQANIERDIAYSVDGATVSGSFLAELKDHETVTMKLLVSNEMFPQTLADTQDYTFALVAMGICGGLALIYWLATLAFLPLRWTRCTEPLQGPTAGEMGCVLNMQGANLHLMVLSWAQLGYILIHIDRHNKVTLHKRMDMGNERTESQRRLFQKLFGKRDVVDTSSRSYAFLCRAAAEIPLGIRELLRQPTGNPKVLRSLGAGIGLFGGITVAVAMSGGAVLQGLLILVLGVLGAMSGWYVQRWGNYIVTPDPFRLLLCLGICGAWLALGALAGVFLPVLGMVLGLLVAGLLLAWSGRRTELGKDTVAQVLALRRYMRTADPQLLRRIQDNDPDYFFSLLPYALALGSANAFAKRFAGQKLEGCHYLTTGMDAHMTAQEWVQVFRRALEAMQERSRQLPVERLMHFIRSLTR